MKGSIMLRFHLDSKATPLGSCKQLKNVREGFCFNRALNLIVRSTPQGYYVEDKMFLVSDRRPAVARDDMPAIREVSLQELTDDKDVLALGCGIFKCEYGEVKVSMFPGRVGLHVDIVSSTVIRFNATIEALRNGELRPVGKELTVIEVMQQKIADLEKQLALSYECQVSLQGEAVEAQGKIQHLLTMEQGWITDVNKLEEFIKQVTLYLSGKGVLPEHVGDTLHDDLLTEVKNLKEQSLWQRLFG